jgi:hypothetical protein
MDDQPRDTGRVLACVETRFLLCWFLGWFDDFCQAATITRNQPEAKSNLKLTTTLRRGHLRLNTVWFC